MHHKLRLSLCTTLVALAISSCATTQEKNNMDVEQMNYFAGKTYAAELTSQQQATENKWWLAYQSEQLNNLVAQGISANHNLRAAQNRYTAALQQLGYEEAQHWPQGGVQLQATRQSVQDQLSTNAQFGASALWQIDLFGRISALTDAALANSLQAQEQQIRLLTEVVSGIVRSYFEWQGKQLKLQIVQQQIAALNESIEVLEARVEEGFASNLDVNRTYAQLNQQKSLLPKIESEMYQIKTTLAVLLGTTADTFTLQTEQQIFSQNLLQPVALAQPEKAIQARSDIHIALHRLTQQQALKEAADAALYPDISISGFVGLLNPTGSSLSTSNDAWSVTPQINWSILSLPALKAQANAQDSLAQAALADYENTVVSAVAESQFALVNMQKSKTLIEFADKRLHHAQQANMQAKAMYEEGQVPYLDLLAARQDALIAQQDAVDAKISYTLAKIATYKAFSGGWSRTLFQ
ncbi:TolC family protein [Catenovulum sediminis]|uniref:TolC family protein n=1 Tax=Catenovulum sediminis TaxID=1740262 RepID=A0ABV1RMR4_9ALTE